MQSLDRSTDIIVIGAGAAGMAAAVRAGERGRHVLLLEKADRPGRKIYASGNGRCNLMNSGKPRYFGDSAFAADVLRKCGKEDITSFFRRYGLLLAEESEGRVYPFTFQSASVVSVLRNAMETTGTVLTLNDAVDYAEREKNRFFVHTVSGKTFNARRLVITCGGAAQPKLGGSTDGYRLLAFFGHSLIPVRPSLVPLNTDPKSISGLSGLRVHCGVTVLRGGEPVHHEDGEVLFTDYGVSGICVMQCARFAGGNETTLELNLLKNAFANREQCLIELKRRKTLFSGQTPLSLLNGILPERLSYAVLKQSGAPLRGETAGETDDKQLGQIADTGYAYRISVTGNRGLDYAQVTAGGIDCSEFNASTMESRIVPGLYAAGEVLNVDGDCGGFNLMFAFAGGLTAGSAV